MKDSYQFLDGIVLCIDSKC